MFQHPPPESSLTRQQGLKIHKEFRQVKAFLVDDPEITKILLLDAWKTALVLPGFMALMHGKQIWTFESTVYLPFGRLALLSMVLLQIVNSHRDFFGSKKSGRNEWTRFAHHFVVAVVCLYILFSGSDRYVCICNMSFFNEVVTPAFSVVEIMKKKKIGHDRAQPSCFACCILGNIARATPSLAFLGVSNFKGSLHIFFKRRRSAGGTCTIWN